MRKAFTMIELVFVITIIGILAAVAIPRLAATRTDAIITKGITTVGALRSALSTERQLRILRGSFADINSSALENLLEYGLGSDWGVAGNNFTFTAPNGSTCVFTLSNNRLNRGACSVDGLDKL